MTHRAIVPFALTVCLALFVLPTARVAAQQAPGPEPLLLQPQPAQTTVTRSRPNVGAIVPGAVLLGVGWITNFIVGLPAGDDPFDGDPPDREWDLFRGFSLIPAVGPWVQLALQPSEFSSDYWGMWLILNGLLQTSGLVILIVGIATPSEEVTTTSPYVTFVPMVDGDRVGAALLGTF